VTSGLRRLWVEPARPERVRAWPGAPWLVVATVCIGAFMGQLDASIVTVALPELRDDLHASLGAVEWVSLSYLLVLIGSVSAVGRLADMTGRKLLYTYGFALFTLASLACGLAPNLTALLLTRIVQAVGAAMLQANSVALIRTTVGGEKLNRAIGLQGAAQALGLALGPAVGGLLISLGGWRWVFYVNVPAGAVGIALGLLLLPRTRVRAPRARFDWVGLATLLPGTALLLMSLSLLGGGGSALAVAVLAGLSLLVLAAFIRIEHRSCAPLVDLRLFSGGDAFTAGVASGLLAYLVLFGVLFVSPLYLESAFAMSSASAGLIITVLPLALGTVALVAGAAADRLGPRAVTTCGMALACLAFAAAAILPGDRGVLIGVLAVAGVGLGLFTPANNTAVAGSGRADQAGMVSGLLNMTRGIGTSLGVAVAGATFALTAGGSGSAVTPSAATHGFGVTAVLLAVAAGGSAVLSARRPGIKHPDDLPADSAS